jgi:uncharacterized protein YkwD
VYRRLFAVSVSLLLLGTSTYLALGSDPGRPVTWNPPLSLSVTSSTEPDLSLIVVSGVEMVSLEEETEMIDVVTAQASTTTTAAASTTQPTQAPTTTATTDRPSSTTTQPPPSPTTTQSQGGFVGSAESDFAGRINSLRASHGLAGLARDGSLDSYARSWAKKMAQMGDLSHSNIGSLLPPWHAVGENVGKGGAVGPIFNALVSSSAHMSNMVGDYTHMGIGVYRDSSGVLWTTHVFTR